MNIAKMEALAKKIEALSPKGFYMGDWVGYIPEKDEYSYHESFTFKDVQQHPCKTVCCIAGYQQLAAGYILDNQGYVYKSKKDLKLGKYLGYCPILAGEDLELTDIQTESLFYADSWPRSRYGNSKFRQTPKGAAARIRFMIKTGE